MHDREVTVHPVVRASQEIGRTTSQKIRIEDLIKCMPKE